MYVKSIRIIYTLHLSFLHSSFKTILILKGYSILNILDIFYIFYKYYWYGYMITLMGTNCYFSLIFILSSPILWSGQITGIHHRQPAITASQPTINPLSAKQMTSKSICIFTLYHAYLTHYVIYCYKNSPPLTKTSARNKWPYHSLINKITLSILLPLLII